MGFNDIEIMNSNWLSNIEMYYSGWADQKRKGNLQDRWRLYRLGGTISRKEAVCG